MVQEDERKMDVLTKRATELTMVNNNAKLLSEMLDHYDKNNCGVEEKQLLEETTPMLPLTEPMVRLSDFFLARTRWII